MTISIVAAMDNWGVIGKGGKLPWHQPADLARFRELTIGSTVVMGRKTWQSLPGQLRDRNCIVVSKDEKHFPVLHPEVIHYSSLIKALNASNDVFIIGGESIYRQTIGLADQLFLTVVHTEIEDGDTHFPLFMELGWKLDGFETHPPDCKNEFAMTFLDLVRI